jgi:7-cyano-7-deazaguanine synthase in queuosine biosynthesis
MNVLLYTPGIDSLMAYWYLKHKIGINTDNLLSVYYMLNTRYSIHEFGILRARQVDRLVIDYGLNLGPIEHQDAYVPGRNVLMALHAAGAYNADIVYLNGTLSDRVQDNTIDAYKAMEKVTEVCLNRKVKITSPFPPTKYKEELVLEYIKENDPNTLLTTFSCYNPIGDMNPVGKNKKEQLIQECLNCKACFRKNVVLNVAGIRRPFRNNLIMESYIKEFVVDFKGKTNPRINATIEYLKGIGKYTV